MVAVGVSKATKKKKSRVINGCFLHLLLFSFLYTGGGGTRAHRPDVYMEKLPKLHPNCQRCAAHLWLVLFHNPPFKIIIVQLFNVFVCLLHTELSSPFLISPKQISAWIAVQTRNDSNASFLFCYLSSAHTRCLCRRQIS